MTTVLLTAIEAGTNYYVALEFRTLVEATYPHSRPPRPAFVACSTKSGGKAWKDFHVMHAAADVT